ncbi:helix-turn-helix domain-containing protein [Haloarchaeobius sp. DYHT-AS-18]|uniref:helix-turn-helix domain-containing protein n=1 Tax=Haloarchaeobius sp. DYHT-AS-18 TaxID=3446117 RepID=UPI003EB8EB37
MATIAEFTFEAGTLPFGNVFDVLPDATIELERVVPTQDVLVPYFWVRGASGDDVARLFTTDPPVPNVELIDTVDGQTLMRAEWNPTSRQGVLNGIFESDLSLLSATGTAEGWVLEVRADDHETITDFQTYLTEQQIPVRLTGIHALAAVDNEARALTETQREALLLAYERGYYASPREVTLEEIAGELGISRQALASRLRRGTNRLIEMALEREL